MVGEGARLLIERALAAAGLPSEEAPRALERFLEFYDDHLLDHTRPYEGVAALLNHLRDSAHMAVLTNKPSRATVQVLEGLALKDYFTEVIAGDSQFPRKPDPTALLHLAGACNSEIAETLMVGDSRVDMETAQNAGARCCLVRYGFGFPDGPLPRDVLIADKPERVAEIVLQLWRKAR
jgi:phosphoglycolate phosphatase